MTIIVINQVEFEMGSLLWKHGGYATDLSLKVENHTPIQRHGPFCRPIL